MPNPLKCLYLQAGVIESTTQTYPRYVDVEVKDVMIRLEQNERVTVSFGTFLSSLFCFYIMPITFTYM